MDDHQEVTTNEARAGSTPGVTRYVLAIGIVLVILAFGIIYAFYG